VEVLLEEVRKVFGETEERKLVEKLILLYKEGGSRAVKTALVEYLKKFGVDVEVKED
jgi:hypothetical protein